MRELKDWLTSYLEYTDNSESPESYHVWCGLGVIAGALQRKVYLKWGIGQVIYPNLYVVLVGPSGRTRKGVAIGIAKDVLGELSSISIAPESSSGRQAMILAMKRATCNFQDPTDGVVKTQSPITVFSEELSVFLGQGDIAYLSNLTDWYDSKNRWEYETVGRGKDTVQGVCLNLVGGTAPEWLQSMIPHEAIGGGFTSRVIFVVEENKKRLVPEYTMTDSEIELGKCLVRDLEKISTLAGECRMDKECRDAYVNWYVEEDKKAGIGQVAVMDPRFSGYCERRATHLRKLMLSLSASRGDDLILTKNDFDKGLGYLLRAERKMSKTFGGLGRNPIGNSLEDIKNYIQKMKITTRKTILQRFYRDVDSHTLSEIEETLVRMGCLKVRINSDLIKKQDKAYEWIEQGKDGEMVPFDK